MIILMKITLADLPIPVLILEFQWSSQFSVFSPHISKFVTFHELDLVSVVILQNSTNHTVKHDNDANCMISLVPFSQNSTSAVSAEQWV